VPRKLSSPRVRRSLAQIHTWQAINSTQCQNSAESRHINTNRFRFLSPFSYGSKSQNPQEAQEHTNPRLFQNQDSTKFNGVCIDSQRFSIESSSLNRFFCNSNASSPPKGSKLKRDHRGVRREEEGRKNLRIQNQWRRRKLPIYFRIQSQKSTNRIRFKEFLKFQFEISE